jgi:AcrR family transcriptional regulator
MTQPTRVLRHLVEAELGRPEMNRRQRAREERILAAGQLLMAQYGRQGITFRTLAGALRITASTLAWHYTDLDALLGEILRAYLQTLHTILGSVPFGSPNRQAELRAAYLQAIHGPFGGLTPLHTLLTRDRHLLPADERDSIERTLLGLSELLAGDLGLAGLDLLDRPWVDPAMAEALLATAAAIRTEPPSAGVTPEPAAIPAALRSEPGEQAAPPPAGPPPGFFFDLQDTPLPVPGSLAAMTDKELDAADRAERAAAKKTPPSRARYPLAANIALITAAFSSRAGSSPP